MASADGVFDLAVERTPRNGREAEAETTFLSLCSVSVERPSLLLPGQVLVRRIVMGPEAPFDAPGRYRIAGTWLGDGAGRVTVRAFDLVIDGARRLASASCRRAGA